jgi:hypothetical protein
MNRRISALFAVIGLAGGIAALTPSAKAADYIWIDAAGGNWNDGGNWDLGSPPGATDNAFITLAGTYTVVFNVDATVNNLTLGAATDDQTMIGNARILTVNGTLTVNANGNLDFNNNSTINGTGTLISNGDLLLSQTTVSLPVTNNSFFRARRFCTLSAAFTTSATSDIVVEGTLSGDATVSVSNSFTNNGAIAMTNNSVGKSATVTVVSGTLTNAAAGTITAGIGSTGGSRTLGVQLDNLGTITINSAATMSKFSAQQVNSGDIIISPGAGSFTIFQLGAGPTVTFAGSVDIAGGTILTIAGGTVTQSGMTLTGTGTLDMDGIVDLDVDLATSSATIVLDAATVNGPGDLSLGAGGVLDIQGATINAEIDNLGTVVTSETTNINAGITNGGDFSTAGTTNINAGVLNTGDFSTSGATTVTGTVTNSSNFTAGGTTDLQGALDNSGGAFVAHALTGVDGAVTTDAASTITVEAVGATEAVLTSALGFTNDGEIVLTADAGGSDATLDVTAGTLTNGAGGTITSEVGGGGGGRTLAAVLANEGTLAVDHDLGIDEPEADHDNGGTISLTGGDLTITQSGATPSVTVNGGLELGAGRTLTVTAGAFDMVAGSSLSGTGTLDVSAAVPGISSADVSPGASAGALGYTGDYPQGVNGDLTVEIGGLSPVSQHDVFDVSGNANLGGDLQLSLINGFFPSLGDTFRILNAGSRTGFFNNVAGALIGGGLIFEVDYDALGATVLTSVEPDTDKVFAFIDDDVCISTVETCATIPMLFTRIDNTPVRGVSVTFELSPELEFCDVPDSIDQGTYLDGFNNIYQVLYNGGQSYTVDQVILGNPCGPTTGGTLFTIRVTNSGGDGFGTITVTDVAVRDCDNQPLPGLAGSVSQILIDLTSPTALADLSSSQVTSGNDSDGTTLINVNFTATEPGLETHIYRKGYGDYPEFDDGTGGVPPIPADTLDAQANGWTLTGVTMSGDTDPVATRDYFYYVAFVVDSCHNISSVSNMSTGTLSYHLGDVTDGVNPGDGDNLVGTGDISILGSNYGSSLAFGDPVNYLDVGPTDDFSIGGLPTTDNVVNFEDLILFGINFGTVSIPNLGSPAVSITETPSGETPGLNLTLGSMERRGLIRAHLTLEGNSAMVKGIHSVIGHEGLEVVDVRMGGLLAEQSAEIFFKHLEESEGLVVDAVALGQGLTVQGSGVVADLTFRVQTPGSLPVLDVADLRNIVNGRIGQVGIASDEARLGGERESQADLGQVRLLGARPNPFGPATRISFRLPSQQSVTLKIYDVQGREVRTLVDGPLAAGEHSVSWNGRNEGGRTVGMGIYLYTLRAEGVDETQKLFRIR